MNIDDQLRSLASEPAPASPYTASLGQQAAAGAIHRVDQLRLRRIVLSAAAAGALIVTGVLLAARAAPQGGLTPIPQQPVPSATSSWNSPNGSGPARTPNSPSSTSPPAASDSPDAVPTSEPVSNPTMAPAASITGSSTPPNPLVHSSQTTVSASRGSAASPAQPPTTQPPPKPPEAPSPTKCPSLPLQPPPTTTPPPRPPTPPRSHCPRDPYHDHWQCHDWRLFGRTPSLPSG